MPRRSREPASLFHVAVVWFGRQEWLVFQGPDSLAPRGVRNRDRNLRHVVAVVRFRELMAEPLGIDVGARFAGAGAERRIHSDPNNVIARRHGRLAVAAVEHEILSAEFP